MNDFVNELVIGLLKSPIIFIPILIGVIYVFFRLFNRAKSEVDLGKIFNKTYNTNSSQNVCPKCGGTLQLRNGKFGKFYGCSNFPKCRYTKKL